MNKEERKRVYDKCAGKCAYCGCDISLESMQVDHMIPIYRGWSDESLKALKVERGNDDMSNWMPSCRECNRRKNTLSVSEFREELRKTHERMISKSANYRQLLRYHQIEVNNLNVTFFFEKITEQQ